MKFNEIKEKGRNIYTKNQVPGKIVYDEKLIKIEGKEYREWNPRRSKLAAAIIKGIKEIGIKKNSVVLYLGASYGTTVSHVSDMLTEGFVFALDFAPRTTRDLVFLAEERNNIAPMMYDANQPQEYKDKLPKEVDIVYMDIAQRNQAEIFIKNCDLFLKKQGYGLLAVKARSIDVTGNPQKIFQKVKQELQRKYRVIDSKVLDPFEKDHIMFVVQKV